jgi:hypothetical protein
LEVNEQESNFRELKMYKIDLLNGRGIPLKSRPGGLAIIAVTAAVPAILAISLTGFYLQNKIILSIKESELDKWEQRIDGLSDAIEFQKTLEKEQLVYRQCLSEVNSAIGRHTQWSEVLITIVENLPDSVVLNGIDIDLSFNKKKIPKKGEPEEMIEIDVPARTLRMRVSGNSQSNSDEAIKDFQARLRASEYLGPKIKNIICSQQSDVMEGRDIISYEIVCVFLPEM